MSPVMEDVTHEMCVMDGTGDTKIVWDPNKQDEIDMAKETFTKMKKKGYLAYAVDRKGDKGTVVEDFDPAIEKLILSPPMRGG